MQTVAAPSLNAARVPRTLTLSPGRALALPIFFAAGLAAWSAYEPVLQNDRLFWSILGSAAVLLGWTLALLVAARRHLRVFILEIVPRAQHYVQACAHTAILLYWGWHWPPVYEYAYLIVAQLLFAYSFDMLLAWSRRDTYTLGFGPFPIIFSTNLFLWFKADWFYLQFLMIAVGAGLPTFYDKLLQVPLLNLTIQRIDRAVRGTWLRRFDPAAIGRSLTPRHRNLAYVTLWATVFAAISAAQGLGDRHRGQWVPFWREACAAERSGACAYLAQLYSTLCDAGSQWSCSEFGILRKSGRVDGRTTSELPPVEELPILLRGSKGPISDRTPTLLSARACAQGWSPRYCEMAAALRGKITAGEP